MNSFKPYRRTQIAEMRPYIEGEDLIVRAKTPIEGAYRLVPISISAPDKAAGSPKPGDMIARNPANHEDQWLVAAEYFAANFEPMEKSDVSDFKTTHAASEKEVGIDEPVETGGHDLDHDGPIPFDG